MQQVKSTIKRIIRNLVGYNEIDQHLNSVEDKLHYFSQSLQQQKEQLAVLRRSSHPRRFPVTREEADRGLFIVGHGRSGTTILLEALNYATKEICLLGEALFFGNDLSKDDAYVSRYNNKEYEKLFDSCDTRISPKFFAPTNKYLDISGWGMISRLLNNYLYAGEKIAFGPLVNQLTLYHKRFLDFHTCYFPRATYLCIIRDLPSVISSCLIKWPELDTLENHYALLHSINLTYFSILNLYLALPNVYVLRHENISQRTFETLGAILRVDLAEAINLYHIANINELPPAFNAYPEYKLLENLHNELVANIDTECLLFKDRMKVLRDLRDMSLEIYHMLKGKIPEHLQ